MSNNEGKNVFSKVFPDGTMIETIYDPEAEETRLAILQGGVVEVAQEYVDPKGDKYMPALCDDLIRKGFVKLPSACAGYTDIRELFQKIRKEFVPQSVDLPPQFQTVASLYVLLSWVYDSFQTIPYLRVIGNWGTGKSRFLQVVGSICYKSMMAGGSVSMASIFRSLDKVQGTFCFDEADFKTSDMSSEITKILNGGHSKGSPVLRMDVDKKTGKMTTQAFNVYAPKILASRERFKDEALESRCLTEHLLPSKGAGTPIHLPDGFGGKALELRNALLGFRFHMQGQIKAEPSTLRGLELPRLKQSALALTSIAAAISEDVLGETLEYLATYENELLIGQKHDPSADVLQCILSLVMKKRSIDRPRWRIYMKEIAQQFMESGESYSELYNGHDESNIYAQNSVSPRKIGSIVQKIGIKKHHDGRGFYIPLPQELRTLEILAERYGFEIPWVKGTDGKATERPQPPIDEDDVSGADSVPF